MRLIDADALLEQMQWDDDKVPFRDEETLMAKAIALAYIKLVEKQPSAQPEIIRCRDCKHRDEYGCCKQWKGLLMSTIPIATDDDDFCSYAKRRTEWIN